jgi:hypothetical protein
VHSARLPADIYFNAGVELKNGDVIRAQQYLFTRVDLNRKSNPPTSLTESKASLYAQQNFAMYIHGQVRWKDNFSSTEKHMLQALYQQVSSVSAVIKGLTLIHSFSRNGLLSYIYAANAPKIFPRKLSQHEIIEKIQGAATANSLPLDYFTYFEMALRRPELFSPKIGVRQLRKSCGPNFIFFLLGMDLSKPEALTGISKVTFAQLTDPDKHQIAVLIDERPYDTTLALAFAQKLLENNHEELAKLTIRNTCRLEKSGDVYDKIYKIVQKMKVTPSGSYRYPVNSFSQQKVVIETVSSKLTLTSLSKAVFNSLGDVPMKPSKIQQFVPTGEYSKLTKQEFQESFQQLQAMQEKAITMELLDATGELLYAGGYPLMAYCFWHQALYMDPENDRLRNKILKQANGTDIVKYSKLLSP